MELTKLMAPKIEFFVQGIPKPAGSKRGFYIAKIKRVVITDDCKGSRDWKTDVKHGAQAAVESWCGLHGREWALWTGALQVSFVFQVLRPKWHLRSNGELRPS